MARIEDKIILESHNEEKIPEEFELLPAVSIYNGDVVIVEGDCYKIFKSKEDKVLNPLALSETLFEQFKKLLILDINGIMRNDPQLDILRKISDLGEIWIDAGVRIAENIIDILTVGAENVVIGTKTLENFSELKEIVNLSPKVIVSIDYDKGIITPNEQRITFNGVMAQMKSFGFNKIIFADLERINTRCPLQYDLIKSIVSQRFETYVGGGIRKNDVPELKSLGVKGAILELRYLI